MSKIFLGLFIFYSISGSVQSASANNVPSKVCYVCDGSVFCELNTSTLPSCKKGSLCTQDQEKACEHLFSGNQNRTCDRPGIFPDTESPAYFYKCWISPNSERFIEEKIGCPENTMFDSRALLCLTEEERKIAKRLREYFVVRDREYSEFLCEEPGFYGCPQDCKKYYYCNNKYNSEIFECPFGTYYNYEEKMCTKKLTPFCKGQLNKIANIERLHALRLLGKIKKMSRNNVPPGLCMKFCEDNWQIITENRPEIFKDTGGATSNGTYEVSLELLDKYEKIASQLNKMIEKISEHEEEDEEERHKHVGEERHKHVGEERHKHVGEERHKRVGEERHKHLEEESEEQNYNVQQRPRKLRGFFGRLIVKALWNLIKNVKSFLRQYVRENICHYIHDTESFMITSNLLTTERDDSDTSKTNHQNYTVPDTSSKHSDQTTHAMEFDSSTSSPPTTETFAFNETTLPEHYHLSTETVGSPSSTFSELSDSTTPMEFDSDNSSPNSDPITETAEIDGITLSQNYGSNETVEYDEMTSSEYSDSIIQEVDFDSTTSDSRNEYFRLNSYIDSSAKTEANEINRSTSPFCSITESESSDSSEELDSQSSAEKSPASDHMKQLPGSSITKESVDSDEEEMEIHLPASSKQRHPITDLHSSDSTKVEKFNEYPPKVSKSDEVITANSSENHSGSDKSIVHNEKKKSFKCPQVGIFRDPDSCHRYYRCIRIAIQSKLRGQIRYIIGGKRYTCKNGKYFSPSLWKCVTAKPLMCP